MLCIRYFEDVFGIFGYTISICVNVYFVAKGVFFWLGFGMFWVYIWFFLVRVLYFGRVFPKCEFFFLLETSAVPTQTSS